MSKKKRFSMSQSMSRSFSEAINIAEEGRGLFLNTVIPLSRIELDPENPRKMLITPADTPHGPNKSDPLYAEKLSEFEKLKDLARTIESSGLIQPIAAYKLGDNYRVVAGHRRCLASMILGKQQIEARVFNEKPKRFELKLVQLIENTAREDLSLLDRLNNIQAILEDFKIHSEGRITSETLHKLTGLSLSTVKYYLAVLTGPADVLEAIKLGEIQSLEKAAMIAVSDDQNVRKKGIEACKEGVSKDKLRQLINNAKSSLKKLQHKENRGRSATRINMGTTKNPSAVKMLVNAVLSQPNFAKYKEKFLQFNWTEYKEATQAFKELLMIIEKECIR